MTEHTEDLLNLLHVLGRLVAFAPPQATLPEEVCARPPIDAATRAAGAPTKPAGHAAAAVGDLFNDLSQGS